MKPVIRHFSIWRGNSENLQFRLIDGDGVAVDLTGSVITLHVDADGVSSSYQAEIPDPTSGRFTIYLSPAATRAFTADRGEPKYEIERVIDREQKTILYGNLILGGGLSND